MASIYDKIPLYCRLADTIEDKISEGVWKKGDMIPSERELCKIYSMSRITVRNAIDELVRQGKLSKVQGKGTFVVGSSIVQNLGNVYSFSKEMEKQGKISTTILVEREIIEADEKLALQLGLDKGDKVIYIERLRCAENQPLMIERSYFRHEGFEFLLDVDLNHKSLYKALEEDYGVKINKAIETFQACVLNEVECEKLNCPKFQYGLLVKRTSYSNDRLVCFSKIVSKGDTFKFTVKLES